MLFSDHSRPDRDRPAMLDAESHESLTYAALDEAVSGLLPVLQYPRKALVFSFCRNDIASLTWYLGGLEAGHAVALLDDGLNEDFKARLISLYAPEFIVCSAAGATAGGGTWAADYEAQTIDAQRCLWRRSRPVEAEIHLDLALMLSTSGSTGSPKFVRLTKSNILSNAQSICEALHIDREDRAITSLPLQYSYGLSVTNSHLLCGATLVLTNEGLTSGAFWDVFRNNQCTSFAGVPYSYQILQRLGLNKLNVPSLHTMTQAGGKLGDDLAAHFHQELARRGGRFFVMYGQTEATARMAILPATSLPQKLGSAGLPIPGGSFAIKVDGCITTQPNVPGELVYTGPNVMMGYATERADLSQPDVLGGKLHTGDIAYLDADGFLYITGRIKRDAKLFGLRVNLDEIEAMLRVHGPTAVIATAGAVRIFCEYGDTSSFSEYRQELALKLKLNARALEFRRIERLPLTANGKIDYQLLSNTV